MLDYLNGINNFIKFTIEAPDESGGIPFLDTKPTPTASGRDIHCSVYRKPTHTDRYLDWNSNHPLSAKKAVVHTLTDRAKNVCSTPEILAKEMEYLHNVLRINHYPEWMLKPRAPKPKEPELDPVTGEEIIPLRKEHYFSVPYYPGLSEEFKRLFKDTTVEVCFKGKDTLRSQLMHPKDKISMALKQNVIYHWTCPSQGCKSEYIGETSRTMGERVREHKSDSTNNKSAIYFHCKQLGHPLPKIEDFKIIDTDPGQISREAREAIHIRMKDPPLNRNIGKMFVPNSFNKLLGVKPKHQRVSALRELAEFDERDDANISSQSQAPRRSQRSTRAKRARNNLSN